MQQDAGHYVTVTVGDGQATSVHASGVTALGAVSRATHPWASSRSLRLASLLHAAPSQALAEELRQALLADRPDPRPARPPR